MAGIIGLKLNCGINIVSPNFNPPTFNSYKKSRWLNLQSTLLFACLINVSLQVLRLKTPTVSRTKMSAHQPYQVAKSLFTLAR